MRNNLDHSISSIKDLIHLFQNLHFVEKKMRSDLSHQNCSIGIYKVNARHGCKKLMCTAGEPVNVNWWTLDMPNALVACFLFPFILPLPCVSRLINERED